MDASIAVQVRLAPLAATAAVDVGMQAVVVPATRNTLAARPQRKDSDAPKSVAASVFFSHLNMNDDDGLPRLRRRRLR